MVLKPREKYKNCTDTCARRGHTHHRIRREGKVSHACTLRYDRCCLLLYICGDGGDAGYCDLEMSFSLLAALINTLHYAPFAWLM